MRKMFSVFSKIAMLFIVIVLFVTPVLALQDDPPVPTLSIAWAAFLALVGWPAFRVAAINILKILKVVKDGTAAGWEYWSNALAFAGVAVLVFMGKYDLLGQIDVTLGNLASVLVSLAVLLAGWTGSQAMGQFIYSNVRGFPIIGYSFNVKRSVLPARK